MLVIDTIEGITFSTIPDTSEVTTLLLVESGVELLTVLDEPEVFDDVLFRPSSRVPAMLEARNTALDTTPKRIASPPTATAFGTGRPDFFF